MSREFIIPNKVIIGDNAVIDSAEIFKGLGKKALIVTGKHVVKLDFFKTLVTTLDSAGVEYSIFDGITGEPTDTMINTGVKQYKEDSCDFLIGIGGGSPIDSIKAIGVLAKFGGDICEYMGREIEGDFAPMVAIPTTAGTGSETTKFTIITDSSKQIKMLLKGGDLLPDIAIIDTMATISSPKSITASTGLDALTHAVESYTSRKAQSLTDTLAISSIKRIMEYLPRAYSDGSDIKARTEMATASFEAGVCINNASVTIVHGMSRPIGALFHVPHGVSNAMLLPACMKFAMSGAVSKFADLGRATGVTGESDFELASGFILKLEEICKICEIPTIEQYGIDIGQFKSQIEKMSNDAIASGSPANTIKEVSQEDIIEIYRGLVL